MGGTNMIKTALEDGLINENTTVIEPTSGNTGIALASVCAGLGIKLILTMPSSMSIERANELASSVEDSFIPQQFANGANPDIHRKTTAKEILADTDGKIDIFVAAIGTGGSITGIGEVLKQHNPDIQVIAVEPEASPVLS